MRAAVIDAFTGRAFSGNPAAVVLVPEDAPTPTGTWMQSVAAEFNLSETAFVTPVGPGRFTLRWFTPTLEVDLCGHATLAAAHWLIELGLAGEQMAFDTMSGRLGAAGTAGTITIDLPLLPVVDSAAPEGFSSAMGFLSHELIGFTGQAEALQRNALVLVAAADLRDVRLNLRKLAGVLLGGVILTAPADAAAEAKGIDVLSRYFCPALGIDEDPVTGSAHSTLADYWCPRLGRTTFRAAQLSARGGLLDVELQDRDDPARVLLRGNATTVMDVTLRV